MNLKDMERLSTPLGGDYDPMADLESLMAEEQKYWPLRFAKMHGPQAMSFLTGTSAEVLYASTAPGTAKNTFTTEVTINDTAGMGPQASIPVKFFSAQKSNAIGRALYVVASGIMSSTVTPTYTFTLRLGAAGSITAAIGLGSAALTTQSGITNKQWRFEGGIVLEALGIGANSTIRGAGMIWSPGGLASPFAGELFGGGTTPGTAVTFDNTIENFFNFNVACSASSASNGVTLQQLLVFGLN
jgi:hypothetical protein